MLRTAFNTSDTPITVDDLGHQIGPGEWGTATTTYEGTSRAQGQGSLLFVDVDVEVEGQNPDAVAASKRTAELSQRHSKFTDTDVGDLRKIAVDADVLTEVEAADTPKRELVELLAWSAAPIPSKKPQRGQTATAEQPKEA